MKSKTKAFDVFLESCDYGLRIYAKSPFRAKKAAEKISEKLEELIEEAIQGLVYEEEEEGVWDIYFGGLGVGKVSEDEERTHVINHGIYCECDRW